MESKRPKVRRFRRFRNIIHGSAVARMTVMKVLGVSLSPTVDLGRADHNFKMIQDGDGTVPVDDTGS